VPPLLAAYDKAFALRAARPAEPAPMISHPAE